MPPSNPIADMHAMVSRFNEEIIGLPVPSEPTAISGQRHTHCTAHLMEEVVEFANSTDLDKQADAMIDLVYVALGRLFEMGVAPGALFEEVHAANMRKHRGEVSKRGSSGGHDAVKPEGWTPPNLAGLLEATRADVLDAVARRSIRERRVPRHVAKKPKILVLGHARHGKDTACEYLRDAHGFKFTSSSRFCAETVILPHMRDLYSDAEQCFHDRANHRAEWYRLINEFNTPDPSRLGRTIFAENDVYCGLRHRTEFHALKLARAFDFVIWIDAADRCEPEPASSISVEPWMADFVVDNNGPDVNALHARLDAVMERIDEEFGS